MNGKILNKEALKAWILSKMVTLTNNLLATTPGISAMDAAQGPVIQGQIDAINSNFGGCSFEQEGNDFYIKGADAVRKKLGSGIIDFNMSNLITLYTHNGTSVYTYKFTEDYPCCMIFVHVTSDNNNVHADSTFSLSEGSAKTLVGSKILVWGPSCSNAYVLTNVKAGDTMVISSEYYCYVAMRVIYS